MLVILLISTSCFFFLFVLYQWLFFKKRSEKIVLQKEFDDLKQRDNELLDTINLLNDKLNKNGEYINNLEKKLQEAKIEEATIKSKYELLSSDINKQKEDFLEREKKQEEWILKQQQQQQIVFQNITNSALEKQNEVGKTKINEILKPFQEQIKECKISIDKVNSETKTEINTKINEMLKQTMEVGKSADNLAKAFKSDKKGQGNFGELKFENLLKYYDFEEEKDYYKQFLLITEEQKKKYPDFIVQAQPNKWLVVDSKFSFSNYEKFILCENELEKGQYLKEYVEDLKKRIIELGEKEYHKLLKQNNKETFDFVCLFFANEMAYLTAISEKKYREEIFSLSAKYKVAILTSSSFSPILQMIKQLWNIENTNANIERAREIIEKWLIKIADFNNDLENVGKGIDNMRKSYDNAIIKLQGKGGANTLAKNVAKLVETKLKPKNGKEREIKTELFLDKNDQTQ